MEKNDKPLTPGTAWQPFTPRGVAAFAHATTTRLVLVQAAIALLVTLTCVWFVTSQWFPVIEDALEAMPPDALIRRGALHTTNQASLRLAEGPRLALALNLHGKVNAGRLADVEVILQAEAVQLCGLFGCRALGYPQGYMLTLNPDVAKPWWGAWRWTMIGAFAAAVFVALLASWWVLGLLAAPVIRLAVFLANRDATLPGSFHLAAAALLPGAVMVAAAILLYGFGLIDPLRLLLCYVLHIVSGLAFMAVSPCFLPRLDAARRANPFQGDTAAQEDTEKTAADENPFSGHRGN